MANGARFLLAPPRSVLSFMFGIVRAKLQILNAVIVADFVNVMNYFFRTQKSSNVCFHNEAVLHDVLSSTHSVRVFRCVNKDIPALALIPSFEVLGLFSLLERPAIRALRTLKTLVPCDSFLHIRNGSMDIRQPQCAGAS